ncbi:MAG: hypothetical protein M3273_01615 [Actinomycetota bacterium]|nr:hypothetical protein [Actinomycetota bacterium]
MATTGVCVRCERTVYLEENETATCPVCSSPVIPSPYDRSLALEGYYLG